MVSSAWKQTSSPNKVGEALARLLSSEKGISLDNRLTRWPTGLTESLSAASDEGLLPFEEYSSTGR